MTVEEAIKLNKSAYLVDANGNTDSRLIEANHIVAKALEKAKKYSWHDMSKNHDDFPTKDSVLLLLQHIGLCEPYTVIFVKDGKIKDCYDVEEIIAENEVDKNE